jgi:hypothetical protein
LQSAFCRLEAFDEQPVASGVGKLRDIPLGPAVRQGDEQWSLIVKWTVFALVNAEELGITSRSVDLAVRSETPDVKRFVGIEGNVGEKAGLTHGLRFPRP